MTRTQLEAQAALSVATILANRAGITRADNRFRQYRKDADEIVAKFLSDPSSRFDRELDRALDVMAERLAQKDEIRRQQTAGWQAFFARNRTAESDAREGETVLVVKDESSGRRFRLRLPSDFVECF